MFVHIWRMRCRKKKAAAYEQFGWQVTLPAFKKIEGCIDAHFIKVFESRKPEYLWMVFWKDQKALEAARTNPIWREQIRRFEAGRFYKTIPLELVCETLASFGASGAAKAKKVPTVAKRPKAASRKKPRKVEASEPKQDSAATSEVKEPGPEFVAPAVEGE